MSKKHQNKQVNIFIGHNHFGSAVKPVRVVEDLPVDALTAILREAIDSPYDDDDIINHVDEFGRGMKDSDAKKARVALRAYLLTGKL